MTSAPPLCYQSTLRRSRDDDMPTRPQTHCKRPGCPEKVQRGYCDLHASKRPQRDESRPNAYCRGYTRSWAKIRIAQLRRVPLCEHVDCDGTTLADVVHHTKPISDGGTNDRTNLMSLCHAHHADIHAVLKYGPRGVCPDTGIPFKELRA